MKHLATILLQTAPAPAGFDFPLVAALTAFIALPVKFLVDVVKGWEVIPGSTLPVVGILVGYAFCVLVLVAAETPFRASVYAQMWYRSSGRTDCSDGCDLEPDTGSEGRGADSGGAGLAAGFIKGRCECEGV